MDIPVPPASSQVSSAIQPAPMLCPQCHQPIKPEYYYCPNCGKKLNEPGLSTSVASQLWLYAFSLILPFLGYLAITYWQGIKYARSEDPQAQKIGWIAIALLAISSIFVIWQATVWINEFIGSATNTAGLSGLL
jgi:Double zinc ribbon